MTTINDQMFKMLSVAPWWRHQMETFSALLAICAGNSPVPGEFPSQRPVTRGFDVFFDLSLNKRLSIQWWGWWFETFSRPLWSHRNDSTTVTSHELCKSWRSHDKETLGALLVHLWWESTVTGGFPSQRARNANLWYLFDASRNRPLNKQSFGRW